MQCLVALDYCQRALVAQLDFHNFNRLRRVATLFELTQAVRQIDAFLVRHLPQLVYADSETNASNSSSENEDDNSLSLEQLSACLSSDELRMREIDAFELVWHWIHMCVLHTITRRDDDLTNVTIRVTKRQLSVIRRLVGLVRFALISPADLVHRVQCANSLMMSDEHLRSLVIDALNYHLLPFDSDCPAIRANNIRMRSPRRFSSSLLVIGGREISPTPLLHDSCHVLRIDDDLDDLIHKAATTTTTTTTKTICQDRVHLAKLPNALSHMQCVSFDHQQQQHLYTLGGCVSPCAHGESATNAVWRYDPRRDAWSSVASMLEKRAYFVAVRAGSVRTNQACIVAIGGKNRDGALQSVERYDVARDRWRQVSPLPLALYAHAGCASADGRLVYVSGGYSSQGSFSSAALFAYSLEADVWTQLRSMQSPRGWHCMCTTTATTVGGERLFVFGGCVVVQQQQQQQQQQQETPFALSPLAQPVLDTECFSPASGEWTRRAPMHNVHKEAACFQVELPSDGAGRLIICLVSGYDMRARSGQRLVSCYEPAADKWHTLGAQLPCGMTGLACCRLQLPWHTLEGAAAATDDDKLNDRYELSEKSADANSRFSSVKYVLPSFLACNDNDDEDDED